MTKIRSSPLREIADSTQAPEDLKEDFIHSLQNQVEVDEPEAEAVPALSSGQRPAMQSDANSGDMSSSTA